MSITIFRGETPTLTLTATTDGTTGFSLTGATMETRFLDKQKGREVILADGVHTLDADQVTNPGLFTLDLTAAETERLEIGENLRYLVKATIAGAITKFEATNLTVKAGNLVDTK